MPCILYNTMFYNFLISITTSLDYQFSLTFVGFLLLMYYINLAYIYFLQILTVLLIFLSCTSTNLFFSRCRVRF